MAVLARFRGVAVYAEHSIGRTFGHGPLAVYNFCGKDLNMPWSKEISMLNG